LKEVEAKTQRIQHKLDNLNPKNKINSVASKEEEAKKLIMKGMIVGTPK